MLHFSKYHGCGNDFVVIDYKEGTNYSDLAIKLCNRKIAVGADGLVVVKLDPLEMIFYNADGSRAPMCGNGIRCFARYVYEHKIVNSNVFDVLTLAGVMKIEIVDTKNFLVKVNMGSPIFTNESIKASDNLSYFGRDITIDGINVKFYSLFMGTIHTVVFVDKLDEIIKTNVGQNLCNHPLFKEKTNVNFAQKIDDNNFLIKTYERGVGWTCACGTGVCATYVVAKKLGLCKDYLNGHIEYGMLHIEGNDNIFMTGPATKVFESELEDF